MLVSIKHLLHRLEVHQLWADTTCDQVTMDVCMGFDGSDTTNPPMPSLEPLNPRFIVLKVVDVKWFGTVGSTRKYRLELSDTNGQIIFAHVTCMKANRRKIYQLISKGRIKPGIDLFIHEYAMQTGIPFGLTGPPRGMILLKRVSLTGRAR